MRAAESQKALLIVNVCNLQTTVWYLDCNYNLASLEKNKNLFDNAIPISIGHGRYLLENALNLAKSMRLMVKSFSLVMFI